METTRAHHRTLSCAQSENARGFSLRGAWRELTRGLRPPPQGRIAQRLRRLRRPLWLVPLFALIFAIYVFYMSAGGLSRWPVYGSYLDLLAEGFRAGQLHLPITPHPALLNAKDPYSFANSRYWAIDATYYAGKYYAYWGPAPSLIWAGVKSALGIRGVVGDQYIGLGAMCLALWSGAVLVQRMARRLFGAVSTWLVALCVAAFALANPVLHNGTTAGTYQTAIMAAQAFLIAGLVPAFDAVWRAEARRSERLKLTLAGVAWGLAIASRVTLMPAIAVLIAVTASLESWGTEQRWRRLFANALWLGLPVACAGISLLTYNKLRFGDWLEFGSKIQLSHFPMRMSADYVLANLYTYTLRPFVASCEFPWVFQVWSMSERAAFPEGFELPPGHLMLEPVIGWLRALPITWLIPFALLCAPGPFAMRRRETRAYVWCVLVFGVAATLTGFIGTAIYTATMRYLGDVSHGLALLGITGALALRAHRWGRALPRLSSALISALALGTIGMGLLIGYQGYGGQFTRNNRALHATLVEKLSFCDGKPANVPKYMPW